MKLLIDTANLNEIREAHEMGVLDGVTTNSSLCAKEGISDFEGFTSDISKRGSGTTYGAPWVYDTHAPMHWNGWDVPAGRSSHPVFISDIASTVATFMNSPFPNGNTGNPMNEIMK